MLGTENRSISDYIFEGYSDILLHQKPNIVYISPGVCLIWLFVIRECTEYKDIKGSMVVSSKKI